MADNEDSSNSSSKGFKKLDVIFDSTRNRVTKLCMKQHLVREPCDERPSDRTLFISNVPAYVTENVLKRIFETCGCILSLDFAYRKMRDPNSKDDFTLVFEKPAPEEAIMPFLKVGYVVFQSAKSLRKALAWMPKEPVSLSTKEEPIMVGLSKYVQNYNKSFVNLDTLDAKIKTTLTEYDSKVQMDAMKAKYEAEEDDEGWTKVTKKSRKHGFVQKFTETNLLPKKLKRLKKKKELKNFYPFQIKEEKLQRFQKLKERFELDKKHIEQMKAARKFRPF